MLGDNRLSDMAIDGCNSNIQSASTAASGSAVADLIERSPLVEQCRVFGGEDTDREALITVDQSESANMCREQIAGLIAEIIAAANSSVPDREKISRWEIVPGEAFTAANTERNIEEYGT